MSNLIPGTNQFTFAQGRKGFTCGGDKYIQNNFYNDGIFNTGYRNNGCCGGGMGYGYGMNNFGFGMGGYDYGFGGGYGWGGGGCCGNSFGDKMMSWIMGFNILSSAFKTDDTSQAGTKSEKTTIKSSTKTSTKTSTQDIADKGLKVIPFENSDKKLQPSERVELDNGKYMLITTRKGNDKLTYVEELTFDSHNNVTQKVRKYTAADGTTKAPITTNYSYEYDKDNKIVSMTKDDGQTVSVSTKPLNAKHWGQTEHVDKKTGEKYESYNQYSGGKRIYTELHDNYQITKQFDAKDNWKSTSIKNADGYLICSGKPHKSVLGLVGNDVGSFTDGTGKKISREEYWALYEKTVKAE